MLLKLGGWCLAKNRGTTQVGRAARCPRANQCCRGTPRAGIKLEGGHGIQPCKVRHPSPHPPTCTPSPGRGPFSFWPSHHPSRPAALPPVPPRPSPAPPSPSSVAIPWDGGVRVAQPRFALSLEGLAVRKQDLSQADSEHPNLLWWRAPSHTAGQGGKGGPNA